VTFRSRLPDFHIGSPSVRHHHSLFSLGSANGTLFEFQRLNPLCAKGLSAIKNLFEAGRFATALGSDSV
jgi:hypothetical protein